MRTTPWTSARRTSCGQSRGAGRMVEKDVGEEERRRRKDLTPMSGELHAPADWTPPGPVAEEYKPKKKEKPLPKTRREVFFAGIRRALFILVLLGGLTTLVAVLVVLFSDTEAARAFPLTFYVA